MSIEIENIVNEIVSNISDHVDLSKNKILFYAIYEEDSLSYGLFKKEFSRNKIEFEYVEDFIVEKCYNLHGIMLTEKMEWWAIILKLEDFKFNIDFKYKDNNSEISDEIIFREKLLNEFFGEYIVNYK